MDRKTLVGRAALIGLAVSAIAACGSGNAGRAVIAATSVTDSPIRTTTSAALEFHPRQVEFARRATVRIPDGIQPGNPGTVHLKVGDVLELPKGNWLPDNPPERERIIQDVMILVSVGNDVLSYQALVPGTADLAVGPVGHSGRCDQPGKCPDATPPPMLEVVIA